MIRFKKWLRDLGTAFENFWHIMITPRHITYDEQTARELLTHGRTLGVYPRQMLTWMAWFAAAGADDDHVKIMAKIISKRRIDPEDLFYLAHHGIDVRPVQKRGNSE